MTRVLFTAMSGPLERQQASVISRWASLERQLTEAQRLAQTVLEDFSRSVERLERQFPNSRLKA